MGKKNPPKLLSISEKLKRLKLFNEKIKTVRRGRFVPQVFRPGHGFCNELSWREAANHRKARRRRRGDSRSCHHNEIFRSRDRRNLTPADSGDLREFASSSA